MPSFTTRKRSRNWSPGLGGQYASEILREGGFGRNRAVSTIIQGQFCLIDWIDALLEYVSGDDLEFVIATWTASRADAQRVESWIRSSKLKKGLWIMDKSLDVRFPGLFNILKESYGPESLVVSSAHAKFVLLKGGDWNIVVNTSCNLNMNARIEYIDAEDNEDLYKLWSGLVDDICKTAENHVHEPPRKEPVRDVDGSEIPSVYDQPML